ncbi:dTDP-glucose 4,6-dehydratase [Paenibacillus shirakamiensis]|uniref:dTDP-glucose 4,6-dehydratase n=1 Tax=Paenibacillus shirakamiensis TaxID=1265935 RepID=A0ABS4JKA4_9BACL|nr:dTDP-glucose 4,6-dehydratase [Paenibacillus shirakamiensis]MBP2002127.1 dTDP-glucose 4,6-dehydratase [Paenibacillus shirakamiensis]
MIRLLVTGGLGFIGSHFIEYMLGKYPSIHFVNLDAATYAGNPDNAIAFKDHPHYRWVRGDITNPADIAKAFTEEIDAVIHFAAESHVDRSIATPDIFARTNVLGTLNLLEASKHHGVKKFVHVSTDEVYGSLGDTGYFTEETPLAPNSPYAASKAGSDLIARSYYQTYDFPVLITRCSNNYGPRQFPEKLIPTAISRALQDQPIPIYGDGQNIRDWLHVEDHCRAIDLVLRKGNPGEVYNVGGHNELSNLSIATQILNALGKPQTLLEYVPDRLGHDVRYAIDPAKISSELGWRPEIGLHEGLRSTITWYVESQEWLRRIQSGAYHQGLD